MSASDKEFQRGIEMMKSSTPDGNTWPRNEDEWSKAVAALEQLGYATYLESGMPEAKARALAHMTHGGQAGRLLLGIGQQVDRERHG
jgi:hypothetical protein